MPRRREELLREASGQGFDLKRPPLMRFHLARTGEREWLFVWTCHHLTLDGWSVGIVLREVFETYAALCAGHTTAHDPAGTFADYLKWLPAQEAGEAGDFWRSNWKMSTRPCHYRSATSPRVRLQKQGMASVNGFYRRRKLRA